MNKPKNYLLPIATSKEGISYAPKRGDVRIDELTKQRLDELREISQLTGLYFCITHLGDGYSNLPFKYDVIIDCVYGVNQKQMECYEELKAKYYKEAKLMHKENPLIEKVLITDIDPYYLEAPTNEN
jgi:hypothetical protein